MNKSIEYNDPKLRCPSFWDTLYVYWIMDCPWIGQVPRFESDRLQGLSRTDSKVWVIWDKKISLHRGVGHFDWSVMSPNLHVRLTDGYNCNLGFCNCWNFIIGLLKLTKCIIGFCFICGKGKLWCDEVKICLPNIMTYDI